MQLESQRSTDHAPYLKRSPISVVIPAYNAELYLRDTLDSVFAQSLRPREVIVVDDGSSDDTVAVARCYDTTVISLENRGAAAARNAGTLAASGEYIAYLDADDIWEPDKLAIQFAALTAYPGPAFSFTDFRNFDNFGTFGPRSGLRKHPAFRSAAGRLQHETTIVLHANDRRPVLSDMYFLPSSVLVRREDVLAIGGYDESLRIVEDYEFHLRLFAIVPAVAVMQPLLRYRRHPAQVSASNLKMTAALFDLEQRVLAAQERYPVADARFIANKGYLLHLRIGICHARLGNFREAIRSLEQSLSARVTKRATLALLAAYACLSSPGSMTFSAVRAARRAVNRRR